MKRFYVDLDINKQELINPRLSNLAAPPSLPGVGQVYFDTTLGILRVYTGTEWISLNGDKPGDIHSDAMRIVQDSNTSSVTFDLSNLSNGRDVTFQIADTNVIVLRKDNLSTPLDPTVNDDSTQGYTVGSHWANTATYRHYICADPAAGNALWIEITNYNKSYKQDFGSTATLNVTHNLNTMDLVYKIYKDNGDTTFNEFIPDSFKILNANQVQATFIPATAGKISIVGIA